MSENSNFMNIKSLTISMLFFLLCGCAPEVGSDALCKFMVDKDKGDWSANEASDFARNCIFKTYSED